MKTNQVNVGQDSCCAFSLSTVCVPKQNRTEANTHMDSCLGRQYKHNLQPLSFLFCSSFPLVDNVCF